MIMYANMYKYAKVFSVAITGTVYIVCIGDVFEFIFLVILLQKVCVTQAILIVVESIKKGLLNGDKAAAVFFDFTDAFGTVTSIEDICYLKSVETLESQEDCFCTSKFLKGQTGKD